MILKFWDWVLILLFGLLTFVHFRGSGSVMERTVYSAISIEKRKMLLFVIDFRDFSCSPCLDSFLGLYHNLSLPFRTIQAWGVLTVSLEGGEEKRDIQIAEKKLRGFVRANRIAFPIVVDKDQVFSGFADTGSCLLLLDDNQKVVLRYDFPLTGGQYEEIFLKLME